MKLFFVLMFALWAIGHGLPVYGGGTVAVVGLIWFSVMFAIEFARRGNREDSAGRGRSKRVVELVFAWSLVVLLLGSVYYANFTL